MEACPMFCVECKYIALEEYEREINRNCTCITSEFLSGKFFMGYIEIWTFH